MSGEGQNGFTYGLLYGRESAPDTALLKKLKSYRLTVSG